MSTHLATLKVEIRTVHRVFHAGTVVLAQRSRGFGYRIQLEDGSASIQGVPHQALQFRTHTPPP
jgi:hypothetical protein